MGAPSANAEYKEIWGLLKCGGCENPELQKRRLKKVAAVVGFLRKRLSRKEKGDFSAFHNLQDRGLFYN